MPASPYSSVQQARQNLAARLVEVCREAGITTNRELARRLGWQESKVSRIVNAITPPSEEDIRVWCSACGADHEAASLIASARMTAGAYVQWRRMERAGLRAAQESVRPIYDRAQHFRIYSNNLVPSLFQTSAYTTAVLRAVQRRRNLTDDIPAAVAARMDRQRVLHDHTKIFDLVLEEQVLHVQVGDEATQAEQLAHLLLALAQSNVNLGIIPRHTLRERFPTETFHLFDSAQASVELIGAYLTVTETNEIAQYQQAFTELAALSVYGSAARNLIAAAIQALS